jgi:hypothetical protein
LARTGSFGKLPATLPLLHLVLHPLGLVEPHGHVSTSSLPLRLEFLHQRRDGELQLDQIQLRVSILVKIGDHHLSDCVGSLPGQALPTGTCLQAILTRIRGCVLARIGGTTVSLHLGPSLPLSLREFHGQQQPHGDTQNHCARCSH